MTDKLDFSTGSTYHRWLGVGWDHEENVCKKYIKYCVSQHM